MKTNTEAQPSVASGQDVSQIACTSGTSGFLFSGTLIDTCARNQPPKGNKGLDIVDGPKPPLHKPVRDPAAARRVVPWSSI
ncbi:hypothetical protein FocTR4_00002769 [Fusarium oxysporum f. sp. cubense]|uniref:Uncharacterized protein n=1 Tax=Fusarium oxysporum f. sp. cubense TaxID=61366 RepID=A0A5C6TBQ0_FUSOC|nr:hypothetical protein FocTR4_00002769 [Fusarium oxysporum f. sp. cubense]